MRRDALEFAQSNEARVKAPRYVVQVVYAAGSPSFTSHRGITGISGTVIEGAVQSISSVSQKVVPEEGRATIGGATIKIVDRGDSTTFTDEIRAQLRDELAGIRDREVRIYVGFSDDFSAFVRVWTTYVQSPAFDKGVYTLSCADKSKALRQSIFEQKKTTLSTGITATQTTLPVGSTSGFQRVYHGAQYSDAPLSTVGYLRLKQSGEIVRYTGTTSTEFTGCTRGCFNTVPKAVTFDPTGDTANYPVVEEFIYLEMPGPWMALAILAGRADPLDASKTLPAHWHLGLNTSTDLVLSDFTNAGTDLYDPSDAAGGFPIRFTHLSKTDGKRFLEKEVYQLLGCYSPVFQDGRLGLRRANRIISTSGTVTRLSHAKVVKHSGITYDQAAVINQVQVDWNYDGEDFTRRTLATHGSSVAAHGSAPIKSLEFRGLHGAKHTERAVKQIVGFIWDRYAAPPIRMTGVELVPTLNVIEVGDVVRVDLPDVQDYTGTDTLNRAMEVQQVNIDWVTGRVQVELFASPTDIVALTENLTSSAVLADAWFTSAGINLATLPGFSAGHLTSSQTLTGHATEVTNAAAIWYYAGDLTIDPGVVITVKNNVQLRVRGFLTVNGKIDGKGWGRAGTADPDTPLGASTGKTHPGSPGILGVSRSGDGVDKYGGDGGASFLRNIPGAIENGSYPALPFFNVTTVSGALVPGVSDLRGSGGPSGGQIHDTTSSQKVKAKGGTGGNGGAGLLIVSRGLGFGVSGLIDLSGTDGQEGALTADNLWDPIGTADGFYMFRGGSGGGGGPGALVAYLDGDSVPYPDLTGKFLAVGGLVPITGIRAVPSGKLRGGQPYIQWLEEADVLNVGQLMGLHDPDSQVSGQQLSNAAYRIQFIPDTGTPEEDAVVKPPAPTALSVTGNVGYVDLAFTVPTGAWDVVEVFYGTANDRAFAAEVLQTRASRAQHSLPSGGEGYYWVRTRNLTTNRTSDWFPSSSTAGLFGRAQDAGLEVVMSANPTRTWNGDAFETPIAWTPPDPYTDLHCQVLQFGEVIAHETVRINLNPLTGMLTWATVLDAATVTVTASPTPANTIRFRFTHTPSGLFADDDVIAVQSGAVGEPGAPGKPGNRILGILQNRSGFTLPTDGYLYVHGFDDLGNPAVVDGDMPHNGAIIAVAKGSIGTSQKVTEGGWLIFDTALTASFSHGGTQSNMAPARKTREGWRYDDGSGWATFTATAAMLALGTYSRSSTAITTATIFGAGFSLAAVPVEAAVEVRPGDIQPGAIDELSAFISTLRPVAVVSALPALPSTNYPSGSVVYLTSDRKLYRANYALMPEAWEKSLDGADIVAGTITAASLAADLVLATLFRTANTGTRVELSGTPADPYPLWGGTGAKGIVSGSPGAGAKFYYDKIADIFGITGTLIAAKIRADANNALNVETSAGLPAALNAFISAAGRLIVAAGAGDTVVCTLDDIYHPSYSGGVQARRLQAVTQPLVLTLSAFVVPGSGSGSTSEFVNIGCKVQYRYDSGSWTDLPTVGDNRILFTETASRRQSDSMTFARSLKPKATGWTSTLAFRVVARESEGVHSGIIQAQLNVSISNLGTQGIVATQVG